jgi:predicted RNA methylase
LRLTDLCEYYEKEIVFKKKITKVLEDTFDNYQNGTDILSLKNECRLKAKNLKTIIINSGNETTEI